MRRVVTVAIVMTLAGCGGPQPARYHGGSGGGDGAKGKPAWVDGQPRRYPDMSYLTAVGRGPARGPCESDARGALAKVFNSRVSQVSRDWQGHFSKVAEAAPMVRVEAMSISQLTRVSTDKVLKGARVMQRWVDQQGNHHCLGVIDREPTARRLTEEIGRLDKELLLQIQQGDGAATPTAKFMAYARAMELMQERQALNVDLRIVHPNGRGVPPPHRWRELVAKFKTSRAKIKVGLLIKGKNADTIATCMAEELTRKGIEVLEGTSDVDVMIHGKLKYQKAGIIQGSVMVQAEINLRITDVQNGRTLAAFSETHKAGRPKLRRSVQLAVSKLCKKAAPSLVQKIREALK